jgi:hypothetical protein
MTIMNAGASFPDDIVIGKDILELVSTAMYIDPLTIYREYVQNAADSIDEAKADGVMGPDETGRVDISIDLANRSVTIRDNGAGVPNEDFSGRLTALGGSRKRGTAARGFRGVGRLAGLGYCQELVFRSRSGVDERVHELRWDCRLFKKLLADHSFDGGVRELVRRVATVTELDDGGDWPAHFCEVELVKPVRIGNDILLNAEAIARYLSQVAPVPFSPEFGFGAAIRDRLAQHMKLGEIDIHIDGQGPLYRPYRNEYRYGEAKTDTFTEVEFKEIEGMDGDVAAVAWIMHHGYFGAIPAAEGVCGLRARVGNIQIGGHRIFANVFPEARFASWAVGEVHVIDGKLFPNGRRDDFETNAHYGRLVAHLGPIGDLVAKKCRNSSVVRNRMKVFEIGALKIDERMKVLEQRAVGGAEAEAIRRDIRSEMFEIGKVVESHLLDETQKSGLSAALTVLEGRLADTEVASKEDALGALPEGEREVVRKMIELIYDCSANRVAAKSLVDRILARLGAG